MCQRYYEIIPRYAIVTNSDPSNTNVNRGSAQFKVEKRATPTAGTFEWGHVNGGGFTTVTNQVVAEINTRGLVGVGYGPSSNGYQGYNKTDFGVDAEL